MMTDEMKDYALKLRKYTRENNDAAIRVYSRLISEESKSCKLTMAEFTFAFSNAVLFSDFLYWLAMYACSEVDFVRLFPFVTINGQKRFLIELPEVEE